MHLYLKSLTNKRPLHILASVYTCMPIHIPRVLHLRPPSTMCLHGTSKDCIPH